MNLILLGPPGAGKGTQAKQIAAKYQIPHISTGDIFRENLKKETELGKLAKSYMDKGLLVPDDVTVKIVEDRLQKDDCKAGFLLDGFPRNVDQADSLKKVLNEMNTKVDGALNIEVSDEELLVRLTGRRVCKTCGQSFHVKFQPPKQEGVCDACGGPLYQRDDDSLETAKNRLTVYKAQTEPLINYYKNEDVLFDINGEQDVEKVFEDIVAVIGSVSK